MNRRQKGPRCSFCGNLANYEHQHLDAPSEYVCTKHWHGCNSCTRIKGGDKYAHLAKP